MSYQHFPFGRSSSMPNMIPPLSEGQWIWETVYRTGQRAMEGSAAFQEFRYNVAYVWAPDGVAFASPPSSIGPAPGAPNDVCSGPKIRFKKPDSPPAPAPASPVASEVPAVPATRAADVDSVLAFAPHESLADFADLGFTPQAQSGRVHYVPRAWDRGGSTAQVNVSERGLLGASEDASSSTARVQLRQEPVLQTPSRPSRATSLGGNHVAAPPLHQHRPGKSSQPAIPSPLGQGMTNKVDLGTDSSGLLSPSATLALREQDTTASTHTRTITDPFVDKPTSDTPSTPSAPHFSKSAPQSSSKALVKHRMSSSSPGSFATTLSTLLKQARPDLPIPPPSLSAVASDPTITTEAAARLDDQKNAREEWIQNSAKRIAATQRAMLVMTKRYSQTGKQQDKFAMQSAVQMFEEASNTDKMMEERRNLFMPMGVRAVRDAQGGLLRGGMAVMERVAAEWEREMGMMQEEGEEKMNGEDGETNITPDMLATLSDEERELLRAHLVGRLCKKTV